MKLHFFPWAGRIYHICILITRDISRAFHWSLRAIRVSCADKIVSQTTKSIDFAYESALSMPVQIYLLILLLLPLVLLVLSLLLLLFFLPPF